MGPGSGWFMNAKPKDEFKRIAARHAVIVLEQEAVVINCRPLTPPHIPISMRRLHSLFWASYIFSIYTFVFCVIVKIKNCNFIFRPYLITCSPIYILALFH